MADLIKLNGLKLQKFDSATDDFSLDSLQVGGTGFTGNWVTSPKLAVEGLVEFQATEFVVQKSHDISVDGPMYTEIYMEDTGNAGRYVDMALSVSAANARSYMLAQFSSTSIAQVDCFSNAASGSYVAMKARSPQHNTDSICDLGGTNGFRVILGNGTANDTTPGKSITLTSGSRNAAGAKSGDISLSTGQSTGGDSGDISLSTGTAAGTRGVITLSASTINVSGPMDAGVNAVKSSYVPTANDDLVNKLYVDNSISGGVSYKGNYDASAAAPNGSAVIGDQYTVTVAGNGGGFWTSALEVGDFIIARVSSPASESDWTVVNKNLDDASIKAQYENNADTNAFTDAEKIKVGHITVTQAVNLDQLEVDFNNSVQFFGQSGEALSGGEMVYVKEGDGNLFIADKNLPLSRQEIATIHYYNGGAVSAGVSISVKRPGHYIPLTGTKGNFAYLGDNGAIETTASTTPGDDVVLLGYWTDTNIFQFKPEYLATN